MSKKKISAQEILKLINLSENYEISELIDNCLAKNKNKITNILNENNYSTEDCIIILRTFLSKTKRILKLAIDLEENKDINKTINSAKPPIFWKDKEIVKVQLNKWKTQKIKELIKNINNVELEINVLWHGEVVGKDINNKYTKNIRELNDFISKDKRVEKVIVPLFFLLFLIETFKPILLEIDLSRFCIFGSLNFTLKPFFFLKILTKVSD